jgi:hypothetical protein
VSHTILIHNNQLGIFNFFLSGVPEGDLEGSVQLQFEESSQEYVGTET